jgi:SAM-dependent methyltransferase
MTARFAARTVCTAYSGAPPLAEWLAALPPAARDQAIEERLGIAGPVSPAPPGEDLVGYHASGVAPIVRALLEVPVDEQDVILDLGSGLGKVAILAALLTGAKARGIELQPLLAERAREAASRLGIDVSFTTGDARDADLEEGSVFFLYLPFVGVPLAAVLERLRAIAQRRAIAVCALGFDLPGAPWLVSRRIDHFWLSIYDSHVAGVPPRRGAISSLSPSAELVAFERPAP